MRRIVMFTVGALVGLGILARKGRGDRTEAQVLAEARAGFYQECLPRAQSLPRITPEQKEKWCACSADRSIAYLGIAGVQRVKSPRGASQEDRQRIEAIGSTCAVEVMES